MGFECIDSASSLGFVATWAYGVSEGASLVVLYCIYGSDYNEAVHPTVQLDSY
ncbi:hypothetical protein OCU04_000065 [Sclerotinia nivalis]|uniref:Uncharacterized protein n=1 Tax=Sclerotinia nivalis TaxID=352851 RepID=A0A9X0AVB8_9HELO|nr:hypothetical protein OCU04_000065 [Sclerotinia nivalis]